MHTYDDKQVKNTKNCMPIDKKPSSMLCRIYNGVRILNEKLLGSRLNSRAVKYGTNSFSILEVIRTSIFAVQANFDDMVSETSERIFIKWEYTQFII